ncbi:ATP-grasp domain-containing protein [Streptomyces sp. NPDC006134]|uniref:ATP-grasp domain-containing protein n=1 Tax=Streptomyces sp. NPDC006134 TaxID=3154467 RepID=UPI0033EF6A8B
MNDHRPPLPDLSAPLGRRPRVLVTGAGGPSGVCFLRALAGSCDLFAGDIDPNAAGLYLLPLQRRWLLPRGDAPEYTDALLRLCRRLEADVLVPTVDSELVPLARAADAFAEAGVRVLVSAPRALERCLDKYELVQTCRDAVRVPHTVLLEEGTASAFAAGLPAVAKPRHGSGSRGIVTVDTPDAADSLPHDGTYLLQELLPGTEYSVDVLVGPDGTACAAVPRSRDKTDSGIVVACHIMDRPDLSRLAVDVAAALGLRGICNVQVRGDREGRPALLEVNPRPPGGMSLTVAAGVAMPQWAVAGLLGERLPRHIAHRELSAVRHWEDVVLAPDGLGTVAGRA